MNLFAGSIGIVCVFNGNSVLAALFMAIALVFDYSDGMMARLLHAKSEIGLQLDSLSDVVSFGVLPGFMVMKLMEQSSNLPSCLAGQINLCPYLALIIPVFSALRLAKFNIDTRQTESFLGVPTPANAIFFGSFPLVIWQSMNHPAYEGIAVLLSNWWILALLVIVFSGLLVSEIPLYSFKFKNLSWRENKVRYVIILSSLLLLIALRFAAIPMIILVYILVSIIAKPAQETS
jgi:CDP-diacylglycerol--serine O-phosphatidyltransferase